MKIANHQYLFPTKYRIFFLLCLPVILSANTTPYVINIVNDTSIFEDSVLRIDLSKHVKDSETVRLHYSISASLSDVNCSVMHDTAIIKPVQNWFGMVEVSIIASDDSNSSCFIYFSLTVLPVNHPPFFKQHFFSDSVANDSEFYLPLKTNVGDVDNRSMEMKYSLVPSSKVSWHSDSNGLYITPYCFIGTVSVSFVVTDPAGLSDTGQLQLYTNKARKFGCAFKIAKFNTINDATGCMAICGANSDGTIKILTRKTDSTVYSKTYLANGSKYIPDRLLPGIRNVWYSFNCGDNAIIVQKYGSAAWDLYEFILFDKNFTKIATYRPSTDKYIAASILDIKKINNQFLIYGIGQRLPTDQFTIDVLDSILQFVTTITLPAVAGGQGNVQIIPKNGGYYVTWAEASSGIAYQNQDRFACLEFSDNHLPVGQKRIITPDVSAFGSKKFNNYRLNPNSNGFLLSFSGIIGNFSDLYSVLLDFSLHPLCSSSLIYSEANKYTSLCSYVEYNTKQFLVWESHEMGPNSPAMTRWAVFNSSLSLLTRMDSINTGIYFRSIPSFCKLSKDTIFKLSFDSSGNAYGQMQLFDSLSIKNGLTNSKPGMRQTAPNIHSGITYNIGGYTVETAEPIRILRMYHLNGKLVKQVKLDSSDPGCSINLPGNGIFIIEMQSCHATKYAKIVPTGTWRRTF